MNNRILQLGLFMSLSTLLLLTSCKHEYQQMVDRELASGVRNDSLFLDIHFGMDKKEFFELCWDLNKKGLLRQGNKNVTVQFDMNIKDKKAIVDFYPDFHQGKIYQMPVTYSYQHWSPWLKHFWSDTLQLELVDIYEKTYGEFLAIEHPKLGNAFVRVDGNRRISIYKKGDQEVRVIFTDLITESKVPKIDPSLADKNLPVWLRETK